ncbi:hypothetical protein [Sterolibacterium denitrificans]|uniref:hypothetical protein n=1 Tax=Sterolibacterium denitrificans TaxID=157592 RepID=UPI0012B6A494|nr:hypothetical protein [Sterolibacterium denitrificans]
MRKPYLRAPASSALAVFRVAIFRIPELHALPPRIERSENISYTSLLRPVTPAMNGKIRVRAQA